jgi:hypothetical protein
LFLTIIQCVIYYKIIFYQNLGICYRAQIHSFFNYNPSIQKETLNWSDIQFIPIEEHMISTQQGKILWYALLAFTFIMLLNKLLLVITFRYEIAGLEPYFNYLVLKVNSGQLFTNPEHYPFIVTQYSPLYFYVVNALATIIEQFGVHEVRAVYIIGRLVNLLCNLLTCIFIYQFLKQHLRANFWEASALAMLVFNLFINHNIGVRPDSLKILFLTIMLMQTYLFLKGQQQKHLYWVVICGILALLSKQDALIPVLITLLILFSHRHYIKSILAGLTIGLVTGLVVLGLCKWQFDLVYLNLIGGISQGANWVWFKEIIRLNYLTFGVQIIFLGLLLYYFIRQKRPFVFVISIVLMFTAALLALFKWGSNFNYFIEFQIISTLLLFVIAFLKHEQWMQWILVLAMVGIYFNNFQNKNVTRPNLWVERDAFYLFQRDKKVADEIASLYLADHHPVICFSLKYALFLNENSIQWAMVNDFPEVFLKNLEALTSELPIKVFDYQFDCSNEALQNVVFMAPTAKNDWYIKKLNTVYGKDSNPFELEFLGINHEFTFHQILCNE